MTVQFNTDVDQTNDKWLKPVGQVSVVVPSHDHAPFVEKCLRSIIKQTLAPEKLLVIDDGSRDDSPRIIERVLKNCPFDCELIVHDKNHGLCATLNEGFANSCGDYFAYLGSDDLWLPEFLAQRVQLLEKRKTAVLAYGHAFFINEADEIFDNTFDYRDDWADYADGDPGTMLLRGVAPINPTVFYRHSSLAELEWNEQSRLEDYEMYLKLAAVGDFAFDPQVLSACRHHGYNTSKDKLFLLKEVIEAQRRNSGVFGIAPAELNDAQRKIKFNYARQLLQYGSKKEAWRLARESWRDASSNSELVKFYVRMMTPMFIVEAKRKLRKARNSWRFERIEV